MVHETPNDVFEKIRQQYDSSPYPRIPLEESPQKDFNFLFLHNLVTPYYLRNQKVIETEGKLILDAGCGTGYKALGLAYANPGAKIIGIDISEESVKLAKQRLEYYGLDNFDFYTLSIEDLPSLGLAFDYINCDEVLYILPDPLAGFQALQSVLKPQGIIRTNFHSSLQRTNYFRAQQVFKLMGLMEENPGELEVGLVQEVFKNLKKEVFLKASTWEKVKSDDPEFILMNYLLQGDKGITVREVFSRLRTINLEFISMVKWRYWELTDLFQDPENLPVFLGLSLPSLSIEDRLHLFELLQPIHRLLDFWCGHPEQGHSVVPVSEWSRADWQAANIYLHPQLRTDEVKQDLIDCVAKQKPFEISRYITLTSTSVITVESSKAASLLPLWEGKQSVMSLVQRWLSIRPLDPITLQPVSENTAFAEITELLSDLEAFMYILLEPRD
jgi:2-polyprenyl-3-methyl-5-hydroxy-6-metoxy-1,4-benzoquinol methylase